MGKSCWLFCPFGSGNIARALEGEPLFDQTFLDWLATKDVPVIDLRDAFSGRVRDISGRCTGVFGTVLYRASHAARKFLFCMGN